METIAVYCSWADSKLLSDPYLRSQLPSELLDVIRLQSRNAYLDALSSALLVPQCSDSIFGLYEHVAVDLLARAFDTIGNVADSARLLSACARLLPYIPSLKASVRSLLLSDDPRYLGFLSNPVDLRLASFGHAELKSLLLAVFRLFSFDLDVFKDGIAPVLLSSLCRHEELPIRYLANRCLALYMRLTDTATQNMLRSSLPEGPVRGKWENQEADYRFLSLYEERRWAELTDTVLQTRKDRSTFVGQTAKDLTITALSSRTSPVGEILLLRQAGVHRPPSSLVSTKTTIRNLTKIGRALLEEGPVVLTGPAGFGKTSLIHEAALRMDKLSSLVTLHLNEQADAKSLLGLYTTTPEGGSFTWQPGVLTQAVKQGRWVFIENLDQAGPEVLSTLIPIIERGELLIPSRREHIRVAPGFKMLATIRTNSNVQQERAPKVFNILGGRLWHEIPILPLEIKDVEGVILIRFPLVWSHCPMVVRVLERLRRANRSRKDQSDGLRELLRWCQRMQSRLELAGIRKSQDSIPEALYDEFLLDGVDCLLGALPAGNANRSEIIALIAEELYCSPQRLRFLLKDRSPEIIDQPSKIEIGRVRLCKSPQKPKMRSRAQPFAKTRHFRNLMESIAACVCYSEPTLLVGETGIGKTAVIQHLAAVTGQELTVINLSQQSESADLIGGFKPVSVQSIIVPLAEEFDTLFDTTFSAKRNESFLVSVRKSIARQNWQRLLLLWDESIRMADDTIKRKLALHEQSPRPQVDKPAKRRRIDVAMFQTLRTRWAEFTSRVRSLRARMSGGEERLAFTFVEGKLVTALRRGHWVLLDEINLATSETLETISSTLSHGGDGSPSILLSDAGQVDRVIAHENFRVFASMNPSTDVGKKDLVPALRTRFTELYVNSPDENVQDLILLIQTYIGSLLTPDQRAASDLALLYLDAKKLAKENQLSDGSGHPPHFSIRTLVRSLLYTAQHTSTYGLRRAMHEGFSMSFMTILNSESEQILLSVLERRILGNHKNARASLNQTLRPPSDRQNYVQFKHYWVSKGEASPITQPHYVVTPFVERNLLNLARATSMQRFPILLQGPTSSGKTSMIEYLANISGNKFVRINNHEHTDLQEYLGTYSSDSDGKLHYKDGVLVDAIRHGKWVVLDELNLAPTDVLEALNRLLDDNRELLVPETQEIVRPHPHFMLFATQNPAGLYGGRKYLSRAFRNRFLELHFDDIPENELEFILRERSQIAPSQCAKIVAVYKNLSLLRQSRRVFEQRHSFVTLRDLFRWALRSAENSEELAQNGFMLLAERVREPLEKEAVKDIIQDTFRVQINENDLYGKNALESAGANAQVTLTWTPATRRLFVLVSKALANNEPVLLVGETGCGKTQLCQAIAQAFGKKLNAVNAHSNTEAGDLIGAQRPVRNRALIEQALLNDLRAILTLSGRQEHLLDVNLESLLALFKDLSESFLGTVNAELLSRVRTNIARAMSLFEWVDGCLTEAMKEGHYFLLDEISLADDSVLERLNSVLEPRRTLFLAEKGFSESEVAAAHGFQFMATMNPGGDHGKRELSAALRNRLTEIWVPTLTEHQDILPILHERLQSFPSLPEVMIEFGKWFQNQFPTTGEGQLGLRDLLGWADFIQRHSWMGLSQAVAQGALLICIDSLGANPTGSAVISPLKIAQARAKCIHRLEQLLKEDLTSICGDVTITLESDAVRVGPFSICRTPHANVPTSFTYEAPTTLENMMRVLRALSLSRPILLEGNPGVGKTAIVAALASLVGKPLTRVNLSEQTDLMDLFGSDVPLEGENAGRFAWRDGPFLKAMQSGGWVLLDEMNLASQSILEGLNSCIDHRQEVYIADLGQTFHRHPDFILFAAQNPHQRGGGRKGLPMSFTNRFTVVYADTLINADLELISRRSFPDAPPKYISRLVTFTAAYNVELARKLAIEHSSSFPELNLRDILRWLALCRSSNFRLSPRQFLDTVVSQRLRKSDQRHAISRLWHDTFHDQEEQPSYYHNLTQNHFQVGFGFMRRVSTTGNVKQNGGIISTGKLPVVESLILCIEHNWPVILAGKSGCGKSFLLRTLASLRGCRLVELSLSRDTDATDLIGGFEQLDYDRLVAEALAEVADLVRENLAFGSSKTTDEEHKQWLRLYQLIECTKDVQRVASELFLATKYHPETLAYAQKLTKLIEAATSSGDVTFQWVDGMLVDALESGSWVVLDNANLCDSSVLDRLNSLLEFDGCLVVTEQHTSEGVTRVIRPHPNFRVFLTMDPRYGELSRAMRNRSIELYIDDSHMKLSPFRTPNYSGEAQISRLRPLNHLKGTYNCSSTHNAMTDAVLENMAHADLRDANQLIVTESDLWSRFQIYRELEKEMQSGTPAAENDAHVAAGSDYLGVVTSADEQPIRSLVNEPLVLLSKDKSISENHSTQYWLQSEVIGILTAQNQLRDSEEAAETLNSSQLTVLQKSIASLQIGKLVQEATSPIADFLSETLLSLKTLVIFMTARPSILSERLMNRIDSLLNWVDSVLYVTRQTSIAEAHFRAYLEIGRKLFSLLRRDLSGASFSNFQLLVPNLQLQGFDLCSGKSLRRMWPFWRPKTASNVEQRRAHSTVETVAKYLSSVPSGSLLTVKQLAKWRSTLTEISERIFEGKPYDPKAIEDMNLALAQITISPMKSEQRILSTSAELLCQCHGLKNISQGNKQLESEESHLLALLAGRPIDVLGESRSTSVVPAMLSSMAGYAGWKTERSLLTAIDCSVSLRMLLDISAITLQPILVLQSLDEEIKATAHAISTQTAAISADGLTYIRKATQALLEMIIQCHSDIVGFDEPGVDHRRALLINDGTPRNHYFRQIASDYLEPAFIFLSKANGRKSKQLLTGAALLVTCLGTLHLMVPDKLFDPALEAIIERDLSTSHLDKLKIQLESLRVTEKVFSGRSANMRCSLLENKIEQMEQERLPPTVFRPDISDLSTVQVNFSNVLHSILSKKVEDLLLPFSGELVETSEPVDGRRQEYETLRQNITIASSRLFNCPETYRDLTVPVMRTLQCLELGARLILSSVYEQSDFEKTVWQISDSTPLLGGRPNSTIPLQQRTFPRNTYGANFLLFHDLNLQVADRNIRRQPLDSTNPVISIFQRFYEEWKHHLEIDQTLAAKRSKFYHYRGGDIDEEADTTGMQKLFPNFVDTKRFSNKAPASSYDPKAIAVKLANVHQRLFHRNNDDLEHLLHASQETIMNVMVQQGVQDNQLSRDAYLPLVFLQLRRDIDRLSDQNGKISVDFYSSSNIREARKLAELAHSVQDRFTFIGENWPEHATPRDVLQCCSEILAFNIQDPVAKMIIKAEKLHSVISEWQAVTSSEFSAASAMQEITSLIISWRKLEMLSWAKLLDAEDQRAQEEARSWWFLLYEIIVAIPQHLIPDSNDEHHVTEMTTILDEFMSNSPIGQYPSRMKMLEHFSQLLSNSTNATRITVINVFRYHDRRSAQIERFLSDGRERLAKDIKEQIKLASWRDTNVVALRESAKKSHHRLFKIVRQYRALIDQSIGNITFSAPPLALDEMQSSVNDDLRSSSYIPDPGVLAVCKQGVANWNSRPERLREFIGAAASMRQVYRRSFTPLNVAEEVELFTMDFAKTIADLRRETPGKLADDNLQYVKQLKSRKRRCLADTLRALREMGVQNNLNSHQIAQQNTISKALASVSDTDSNVECLREANRLYYDFLDILALVRERLRGPTDELNPSEITRGAGFSEGLMHMLKMQRNSLAPAMDELPLLESVVERIKYLGASWSEGPFHCLPLVSKLREGRLYYAMSWLPPLLDLSRSIIDSQQQLSNGDLNFTSIITGMSFHAKAIAAERDSLDNKNQLFRTSIRSALDLDKTTKALSKVTALKQDLELWDSLEPRLHYLLKQLIPWADLDMYPDIVDEFSSQTYHIGSSENALESINRQVSSAADQIFVAMQLVSEANRHCASSTEDARWLLSSENSALRTLKALHIGQVAAAWEQVLLDLGKVSQSQLQASIGLSVLVLPVLEQYLFICRHVIERYAAIHKATCKMSFVLCRTFSQILSEGFCNPVDSSTAAEEQGSRNENGTGLGDGEGAEDISKDVEDDEDLSEFAHQGSREGEREEFDATENAVDMDNEDLEGDMDEGQPGEGDEEEIEAEDGDDSRDAIDEEAGNVDNLDPATVDEKLWDGLAKNDKKMLENQEAKGKISDEQAASQMSKLPKDQCQQDATEDPDGNESQNEEIDNDQDSATEDVTNAKEALEQMDQHVQQEKSIDLPEEMQLDGNKGQKDDFESDDALDELSDMEDTPNEQDAEAPEDFNQPNAEAETMSDIQDDISAGEDVRANELKELLEDEEQASEPENEAVGQEGDNNFIGAADDVVQSDSGAAGESIDEQKNASVNMPTSMQKASGVPETVKPQDQSAKDGFNGTILDTTRSGAGKVEKTNTRDQQEAFRKLGDILERWHRQKRDIFQASEKNDSSFVDVDMADVDFEHVRDEADSGETQAVGAGTEDQARRLDEEMVIEDPEVQPTEDQPMHDIESVHQTPPEASVDDNAISQKVPPSASAKDTNSGAFIPNRDQRQDSLGNVPTDDLLGELSDSDPEGPRSPPSTLHLPSSKPSSFAALWNHYSTLTHTPALYLAAQLRLLLPPTTATKLRGDYRTGKRLNMKRIIPFIASGYRRDKIWLRRSLPSKRNYQVIVAVDDSRSMLEGPAASSSSSAAIEGVPSGLAGQALEALALVAKGLSMLDIGSLAILAFGSSSSSSPSPSSSSGGNPNLNPVTIAHPFTSPFTESSGPAVFSAFTFRQSGTDVAGLVRQSVSMFREARQQHTSTTNTETWQLEIILGDAVFDNHDEIRRLVRAAGEERIAFVYVVVDPKQSSSSASASSGGQSILNLQRATFDAQGKLVIKRYLETFPFPYYVVVREVGELGGVLCEVLRGWFGEVGGSA